MQLAMVDDRIKPLEEVDPAHLDRGIFFGDGVYEVLACYDGRIFALGSHFRRFAASMAAIGITQVDIDLIRRRILKSFEAAEIPHAAIYFHITRGSAPRRHVPPPDLKPNFFLTVTERKEDADAKNNGIAVSTFPDLRWKRCDIKSLNLLPNVLARRDAVQKGSDEAILVNDLGLITEGAASSFFGVFERSAGSGVRKAYHLQTAPLTANILPSVTRLFVIQAARDLGIPVLEQQFTPDQARAAKE